MPVTARQSGLLVARDSMSEEQIDRELRRLDDRLFLTKDVENGRWVYKVMCWAGSSTPPGEICRWIEDLSFGLVEKVKSLRAEPGNYAKDLEAQLERMEREQNAELEAVAAEAIQWWGRRHT